MSYIIDAYLEQGQPHLRVVDSRTGKIRLRWVDSSAWAPTSEESGPVCTGAGCTCGAQASLRRLFKALTVLACVERISLAERRQSAGFGEECLECTACISPEEFQFPTFRK